MSNDIVTILRDISNERGLDEDLAQACLDGAKEIERLRLTAAERSAVADAADRYAEITPESAETAATLRGLLERMG